MFRTLDDEFDCSLNKDIDEESNLDEESKTKRKNNNEWDSVSIESEMNSINLLELSSERKEIK